MKYVIQFNPFKHELNAENLFKTDLPSHSRHPFSITNTNRRVLCGKVCAVCGVNTSTHCVGNLRSFLLVYFKEFTLIYDRPDLVVSLLFSFGGRVGAGIMQSV